MNKFYALLSFVAISFIANNMYSQGYLIRETKYYHAVGIVANANISSIDYKEDISEVSYSGFNILPGVQYKATIPISENMGFSLYPSLSILAAGEVSLNSRNGSSSSFSFSWAAGIPVNFEYYFGGFEKNFWAIGLGAEYHYFSEYYNSFGNSGAVIGPNIAISKQFIYKEKRVIARLGFTHNVVKSDHPAMYEVSKDKRSLISLSFLYVLGSRNW